MTSDEYAGWLAVARRHSRVASEAEDLLHDALLAAAEAGRLDLAVEPHRRWLTGTLRNLGAFRARSAVRRKQRDSDAATPEGPVPSEPLLRAEAPLGLPGLPRSARSVLALALHGLRRDEICAVLGISDAAFRQRLVVLRRGLGRLPEASQQEALADASRRRQSRGDDHALGLIRRALLARNASTPGLGTHDPDGHLLVLGTVS